MKILKWLVGIILTVFIIFPFYWIAVSSFKTAEKILNSAFFPFEWTFQHYQDLITQTPYLTNLLNSVFVAVVTMVLTVVIVVPASYAIYRMEFAGRDLFYKLILATYIFPSVLLLVPVYNLMSDVHLIDSLWSLVIMNVTFAAPFAVWLMQGFFESVPKSLDESAAIDGASMSRILFQIILPLIKPGIATIAIYAFVTAWTEFTFSSILIVSDEKKVLTVGLNSIMGQYTRAWGNTTAAAVFTLLPVLIFFAFVGKYFVKGLTSGAVK